MGQPTEPPRGVDAGHQSSSIADVHGTSIDHPEPWRYKQHGMLFQGASLPHSRALAAPPPPLQPRPHCDVRHSLPDGLLHLVWGGGAAAGALQVVAPDVEHYDFGGVARG
ncbi:hypothetical protein F751_2541 [Auxenochlorella protothecoides]|uniref:Uncharacterized protein n=1 Tax=Auxenochlorella protothecoides TaxID=3075 RepID=A0A087SIZ5_AUXPR|nr:hypothetical protein F751_2541 [Auxenochlorella protothecoides]KFM25699.1 hypothetical protein F751_2541 [Auxenochlorella protothecoides]